MQTSNGPATSGDWREWAAFLGYVLVAALLISIALASIVLVLSVRTDDDLSAALIAESSASSAAIAPAGLGKPGLFQAQGRRADGSGMPMLAAPTGH